MSDNQIPSNSYTNKPASTGQAKTVYYLFIAAAFAGLFAVVGVCIAYFSKAKASDFLKSHYNNQINIFWKYLIFLTFLFLWIYLAASTTDPNELSLFFIISIPLMLLFIAFMAVWFFIRILNGLKALSKGEAIENPGSWGF